MSIIGTLPFTFTNGTTADANQVDAVFNFIVNQVNTNALALAGGALTGPITSTAGAVFGPAGPLAGYGVNDGSNAAAGMIGEYISSLVLIGGAVTLASGAPANITSISLTAGDWDVEGNVAFNTGGGLSSINLQSCWTSRTSATDPGAPNNGAYAQLNVPNPSGLNVVAIGRQRVTLAAPASMYLSTLAGWTGGFMTAYGFISARRVR